MNKRSGRIVAVFVMAAMLLTCMSAGADVAFAKSGSKKGISLTPKSVTLKVGDKKKVKVKYSTKKLQKKLKKKTVKWSTSNKKIATVSKGTIKAKKVGTVTITAKVGKYKAKVKVKVKKKSAGSSSSASSPYVNVTDAYTYLNEFRTKPNQWLWNEDGTKKYFNTNSGNTLASLKRDEALEKTAKTRAKEIAAKFSHTRPNGEGCFTAYPSGLSAKGENIAYGYTSAWAVTSAWIEEKQGFANQGHRRNMLNSSFNCVGIAGYKHDGSIYWVQCFGRR